MNKKIFIKQNVISLLLSLLLGIIFVFLFYQNKIGISYPIFILIVLSFFHYLLTQKYPRKNLIQYIISFIIILLSSIFFIRDISLFWFINILIVPMFIAVKLTLLSKENIFKNILFDSFKLLIFSLEHFHELFESTINMVNLVQFKKTAKVLIGVLVSIPLVLIVLILMMFADEAFAHIITDLIYNDKDFSISPIIFRVAIALFVSSYLFGCLQYLLKDNITTETKDNPHNIYFDTTATISFLSIFTVLFFLFSYFQCSYLFLRTKLPSGITYSEYARKGFFELLVLTIINLLIVIVIRKFVKNKNIITKVLLSIMTASNAIMLLSSYYRMSLYESTYGYTRLRLYVYLFLLIECIILILLMYKIWVSKFRLFQCCFVICLTYYLIISFLNIDGIIANRNIERCILTKKIDIEYLLSLSDDAANQLEKLMNIDDKNISKRVKLNFRKRFDYNNNANILEFNWSKYQAQKIYKKY